ncbi:MAG: hypothetical protein MUP81_04570 [Dehalococcoidia bacterium]|nr:hypothetical protein [Dehalococcoidia bacterium]
MFYVYPLTVPANTPEGSAVIRSIPIANGVIYHVELEFEKWCANLLHLRIYRFEHMIYPSNPLGSFTSDGETISFDDYFEVFEDPYTLKLAAWNDDDFFEWTVNVRIGVLPRAIAEHVYGKMSKSDVAALREAFGLLPEEG